MRVSIFGGASCKVGDAAYSQALQLGTLLGKTGKVVLTGGYIGTMEAVSRGAKESGGHVIGVTCSQIELWRGSKANPWVMEEWSFKTLRERMYALIDNCDAALVLPGGVGTLAELAVTWNEQIINGKSPKPILLIGKEWKDVLANFYAAFEEFINPRNRALVLVLEDIATVVETLDHYNNEKPILS